jgi:hypothetical protein
VKSSAAASEDKSQLACITFSIKLKQITIKVIVPLHHRARAVLDSVAGLLLQRFEEK